MRFKLTKITLFSVMLILGIASCKKSSKEDTGTEVPEVDFHEMKVPGNFSYAMTDIQPLSVEVLLLGKIPYNGAAFEVYLDNPAASLDDPSVLDSLRLISKFKLNSKGQYSSQVKVPTSVNKIYLLSKSIGIPEYFELVRSTGGFALKYDPSANSGNRSTAATRDGFGVLNSVSSVSFMGKQSDVPNGPTNLAAPRSWNNVGFPDYLIDPVYVSANFLRRFQAAVPYKKPINTEYLSTSIPRNIVLDLKPGQTADVDITFMFANSANKNALGYYWYNTSTPPTKASAIPAGQKGYVFPSTSRATSVDYSGLVAGHTVSLVGPNADGSFPPNTTIGFFLISNSFTPAAAGTPGTINTTRTTYYSDSNLNSGGTVGFMAGQKQRMVTFYDEAINKIVWSVEDGTDGDYSDVAFFASWNPNDAVPTDELPTLPEVPRTDADYVFYPAKDTKGTLLFEDCWPRLADFDMNDMVLNHNYTGALDENGKVSQINFKFDLLSISAQQNNGFAVMLPDVAPGAIQSISVNNLNGTNTNSNSNLVYTVESGHTRDAVIRIFDDATAVMGANVVNNTGTGSITSAAKVFSFTVNFKTPVEVSDFYNISPFIIPRGSRIVETHLANKRPSVKASTSLFQTEDDNSAVNTGIYYLSNTRNSQGNLCWAVDVPMQIPYPKSGRAITGAYKNFVEWATSGGHSKTDWYTGGTDNRNAGALVYPTN